MTTYVYETVPPQPGEKPRYFEIKQSMKDEPLAHHPETGVAIRRVVLGGYGVLSSAQKASAQSTGERACCRGPGCCN